MPTAMRNILRRKNTTWRWSLLSLIHVEYYVVNMKDVVNWIVLSIVRALTQYNWKATKD